VIVADTDHLGGSGSGDRAWVWKSFRRGLNVLLVDRYVSPDSVTDEPYEEAEEIRLAMGHTMAYAHRMNLNKAVPRADLSSSTFTLADVGTSYITYLPENSRLELDLRDADGKLQVEWFGPVNGETKASEPIDGGGPRTFDSPFPEESVLFLYRR
jgi:hypothetical protein